MPIHSHVNLKNKPTILVLFGATGDLVARKLIPSLYLLYKGGYLPEKMHVIGFSRRDWSDSDFKDYVAQDIMQGKADHKFLEIFSYVSGTFQDLEAYKSLDAAVMDLDKKWNVCASKLYYLAVPPEFYLDIFENLAQSDLAETRVIVEKPFGKDLATSKALDAKLATLFDENQIYRVDHYLGKEVLQNMLYFRFSNNLLENNWDNSLIEQIDISFFEEDGVKGRGSFYDGIGALRDVGQNHMLQMLALTTMSDPLEFTTENIRENRAKILESLKILSSEEIKTNAIRGQCDDYTKEEGVANDSTTETYFKIQAFLDNNKWYDVPITLEGGKYLDKTDKKVIVTFRGKYKNKVIFDLDGPDVGVYIELYVKKPGLTNELEKRVFALPLCEDLEICKPANAYELLLLECIEGNQAFFVSTQEVNAAWEFVDPIIRAWQKNLVPLQKYEKGKIW